MATIKTVTKFELTPDEKTWLSFANLGLADIVQKLTDEEADCLENSETGEIMCVEDFKRAFNVIDYLLDGNLEVRH